MEVYVYTLEDDETTQVEINLSKSEFIELFNELKKNELCLSLGMISTNPLIEIGRKIIDRVGK